MKSVKSEVDLPLLVPNNIFKFQAILPSLTKVIKRKSKRDGLKHGRTTVKHNAPVALWRGHKHCYCNYKTNLNIRLLQAPPFLMFSSFFTAMS
jgi:hypothetical protein